jgi:O-antigen ligase
MIRDNLAFGIGYENFQFYYRQYGQWDVYLRALPTPHNTYLWVMLMGGLTAFIPFMAFLGTVALSALKLYARRGRQSEAFPDADLAATFLASMATFWAPALVMDVLTGYYNTMIMFLIIGAFFGAVAGERRKALVAGMGAGPRMGQSGGRM